MPVEEYLFNRSGEETHIYTHHTSGAEGHDDTVYWQCSLCRKIIASRLDPDVPENKDTFVVCPDFKEPDARDFADYLQSQSIPAIAFNETNVLNIAEKSYTEVLVVTLQCIEGLENYRCVFLESALAVNKERVMSTWRAKDMYLKTLEVVEACGWAVIEAQGGRRADIGECCCPLRKLRLRLTPQGPVVKPPTTVKRSRMTALLLGVVTFIGRTLYYLYKNLQFSKT